MKYLNKETNGITLSRIGLGAMRMADVQQGVDTIHAALDSGITYLNTGDFYGHGESELVIREALKTRKREDILSPSSLVECSLQMIGSMVLTSVRRTYKIIWLTP